MNARDRKKQKRILEKKRELEAAKVAKEAEREAKRAKAQAEREKKEAEKEAAWQEDVERLEAKKAMIAEMVMVRDYEGLRGEAIEGVVGFAMNWAGPVLAVGTLAALPLASEIADYAAEILPFAGLGTVAYLARRWWRVRHPTIEELEEQLLEFEDIEEEEEEEVTERPQRRQRRQRMAHIEDVAPPTLPLAYKKTVGFEMPKTILELINSSRKPHFLIVGETGSGKTTLVKHVIKARAARGDRIVICDPHNVAGAWGPHDVRAGGADWIAYRQTLNGLHSYMAQVLKQLNDGRIKEGAIRLTTCYIGEWSWASQEMGKDAANTLASLIMGGRKAGIRLIIDAQSERVESLGIKGRGDLRNSLAHVKLSLEDNGARYAARYEGRDVPTVGAFDGWVTCVSSSEEEVPEEPEEVPEEVPEEPEEPEEVPEELSEEPEEIRGVEPEEMNAFESEEMSLSEGLAEEPEEIDEYEVEEINELECSIKIAVLVRDGASDTTILKTVFGSSGGRYYKHRKAVIAKVRRMVNG